MLACPNPSTTRTASARPEAQRRRSAVDIRRVRPYARCVRYVRAIIVLAALTIATSSPVGARHPHGPVVIERALLARATICEMPSPACPQADEVARFTVDGSERRVGIRDLVVLQGSVTSGQIFSELRPRPVRLLGPKEELAKLRPGVPLKMQAVLRLGAGYVFVESLEPATEKEEGAER